MQKLNMADKTGRKRFLAKIAKRLCGPKSFIKILLCHTISEINVFFANYAECIDGHKKWRENDFWQKVEDDSLNFLGAKTFVEIVLSHAISKINALLLFMQNFMMATING